jgi:hypothetical protein
VSRVSGYRLRPPLCWFCGGPATEVFVLDFEWQRPACEACLVEHGLTTKDESEARQVGDLRALLAELA